MISHLCSLVRKSLALLAVLIVCLLPAVVAAETVNIKNCTAIPVVVIVTAVEAPGAPLQRDAPANLKPNEKTFTVLKGKKLIEIRDPAAPPGARPLCQLPLPAGTEDVWLEIVMERKGPNTIFKVIPVPPPKREP